jgi:hypothetical protein
VTPHFQGDCVTTFQADMKQEGTVVRGRALPVFRVKAFQAFMKTRFQTPELDENLSLNSFCFS